MHPVMVILFAWLALDVAIVALAMFTFRHRPPARQAVVLEIAERRQTRANR